MKRKAITAITAAILLMSSTPVLAATSNCPLNLSNSIKFSSASLVESCNNYLTNLKSNCSDIKGAINSNCSVSDLSEYLKSCGFNVATNTADADSKADKADKADKTNCKAKASCAGTSCKATDKADCTGTDCNAADTADCTGTKCNATVTDVTDNTSTDVVVDDSTEVVDNDTEVVDNDTEVVDNDTEVVDNDTEVVNNDTEVVNNDTEVVNNDTATPVENTSNSTGTVAESQYISEVVRLVNIERAKEGLSALSTNGTIQAAAQVRAQEIVSSFSHTRPNGSSPFTALDEAGVRYSGAGENIAYGQPTPAAVVDAWMNSPGHRANIMNPSFTTIGVGCYNSGGTYYWSQFFTA